jgi:hypothetical protein
MTAFEWIKSSYSGTGETSTCVEVAFAPELAVRDSKAPTAGHLTLPAPAWAALVAVLRD